MGAKLHNLRVAVWGEAPETPEERKVRRSSTRYVCRRASPADIIPVALAED